MMSYLSLFILRSLIAACALLLVFDVVKGAQRQPPVDDKEQQRVEEAADRVMKRFYETLNFEDVWKEMVVSNSSFRAEEVVIVMFQLLRDSKIPYADQEKAYIAEKNFQLLLSAVRFTARQTVDREKLEQELKEPYESTTRIKQPIVSAADLNARFTSVMNHMNDIFRKYVSRDAYNGAAYKAETASFTEDAPDETQRLREIFTPVGLRRDTKIYLARREMFYLYLIKEGDTFKLLTLSGRRRD